MNEYKQAGVDVEAGYESVERIKKHIERTRRAGVLGAIGGFGGLFELDLEKYRKPVLVSGTDGVGTKLKIAHALDVHDTVGVDCVAMCVNDIVCAGAEPLFFLDYIACGKIFPGKIEDIVKGVADGCADAGCAIVGGETAEMPGMYGEEEYDIAGFAVGVVEKDRIIDKSRISEGDVLLGLSSSGVHSNGFSLVRRIFGEDRESLMKAYPGIGTIGMELLKPTRIYVRQVLSLMGKAELKGIGHVTGGGFIENIPRMLPDGLKAVICKGTWPVQPVFTLMKEKGNLNEDNMYNIFNMGIGLVIACAATEVKTIQDILNEDAHVIGTVEKGRGIDIL
ncbi:MAG: phosphoribosylformylglycinamidine cyclo-ligase [Clostridia bacterium]